MLRRLLFTIGMGYLMRRLSGGSRMSPGLRGSRRGGLRW
jgi:hypothetical protein